jgi:hypothetical protein
VIPLLVVGFVEVIESHQSDQRKNRNDHQIAWGEKRPIEHGAPQIGEGLFMALASVLTPTAATMAIMPTVMKFGRLMSTI